MAYIYSDPKRENDPHALPDESNNHCCATGCAGIGHSFCSSTPCSHTPCAGCAVREPWEHRCFGTPCPCEECREPNGPFDTEAEAVADAQDDGGVGGDDGQEDLCTECCADEGFSHPVTGAQLLLPCAACGYKSHHYNARATSTSTGVYATAIYSGADDSAGNYPEVEITDSEFRDGDEMLISWCCGAPRAEGGER